MPKVLITSGAMTRSAAGKSGLELLEKAGIEYDLYDGGGSISYDELRDRIGGYDAVIAGGETYDSGIFDAAGDLKLVSRLGVGYDKVDVAVATERGIAVSITIGGNKDAVADMAIGLMLAAARDLVHAHIRGSEGNFSGNRPGLDMWQKTLGIVGFGNIGRAVAKRAKGFDMRILAYDVNLDRGFCESEGIEPAELDTLLRESDCVSVHVPGSAQNVKMFGVSEFKMMKPTAIFVNTARGTVVDEKALYDALVAGEIAAAALDVMEVEPPKGNPLYGLSNCILTPHIASNNESATINLCRLSAESVVRMLVDGEKFNVINM